MKSSSWFSRAWSVLTLSTSLFSSVICKSEQRSRWHEGTGLTHTGTFLLEASKRWRVTAQSRFKLDSMYLYYLFSVFDPEGVIKQHGLAFAFHSHWELRSTLFGNSHHRKSPDKTYLSTILNENSIPRVDSGGLFQKYFLLRLKLHPPLVHLLL